MLRIIATLTLVGALSLAWSPPEAAAVDYDCSSFVNQADAQLYLFARDPYRLDSDRDGIACETLRCPCAGLGGVPIDRLAVSTARSEAMRKARRFARRSPLVDSVSLSGCSRRARSRVACEFQTQGSAGACGLTVAVGAMNGTPETRVERVKCPEPAPPAPERWA